LAKVGGNHSLKEIKLVGKVASGHGDGRKYLELAWVRQQIKEKLGFSPYLGTLNLFLDEENVKRRRILGENVAFGVCWSEGFCTGLLFKASIGNLMCGVVVPQVNGYRDDLLEVVASVNLRQKLRLRDGDRVTVLVFV
jgi:riboflavin kinase